MRHNTLIREEGVIKERGVMWTILDIRRNSTTLKSPGSNISKGPENLSTTFSTTYTYDHKRNLLEALIGFIYVPEIEKEKRIVMILNNVER